MNAAEKVLLEQLAKQESRKAAKSVGNSPLGLAVRAAAKKRCMVCGWLNGLHEPRCPQARAQRREDKRVWDEVQARATRTAAPQKLNMKYVKLYLQGAEEFLESALKSTGGKFAGANDLNTSIQFCYNRVADLVADIECSDYNDKGKRTAR